MRKLHPLIILDPVDVKCTMTTPVEFMWRNSRYKVEVERIWREVDRRWFHVEEKTYYQVRHDEGNYLLLKKGNEWFLERRIR